jgi:cell wall-associated NlpC family hydrolase
VRAGVAGGVLGTLAMTAGSASAVGEEAADPAATTAQLPVITGDIATASERTAASLEMSAAHYELEAAKQAAAKKAAEHAADEAEKKAKAEERRRAEEARRAAAAEAAEERASRSSERSTLSAAPAAPAASGSVGELVSFLRAQVGKAYVMGASGPSSYDCSGLVQTAFQQIGVSLPRVSQSQSTAGTPVSVSALQPGDILYWGGAGSAYHVAVYVGGGQYIDAANPEKGVVVQNVSDWPPDGATRVL